MLHLGVNIIHHISNISLAKIFSQYYFLYYDFNISSEFGFSSTYCCNKFNVTLKSSIFLFHNTCLYALYIYYDITI